MDRSIAFYDVAFGALGGVREETSTTWTRYGRTGESAKVCLTPPFNHEAATFGNGTMLAFSALDYAAVDAFHAAALSLGGTDGGLPGVRERTHYVAYARDPEGNKLCVFTPVRPTEAAIGAVP